MQLKAAKVLPRRRIWRPAEEGREDPHVPSIVSLGVFGEPARRHVVDHALTQRADGLVGHRESSCLAWGCEPHDFETGSGPCVGPGFSTSRRPTRRARRGLCGTWRWRGLGGAVTLPREERERSTPYGTLSRRDGLTPRGHRRGA